jgi:hypothetical protein
MNRRALLVIFVLVGFPSVALANPSPMAGEYGPFIGLFVEAVLVAVILGSKGFDPIRFFYSWAVLTTVTFFLLLGGFYALDWLERSTQTYPGGAELSLFLVAEAAIVLVEAVALWRMSRLSFFQRKKMAGIEFSQALLYSFAVNGVSFLFGL